MSGLHREFRVAMASLVAVCVAITPQQTQAKAAGPETTRVSVSAAGLEGSDASKVPSISANGRFVTFSSSADNLVPGDTNAESDVFVHDLKTGETTRVSVDSAGVEGNGSCEFPSISANGRFVAFRSSSSNLVAGDGNGVDDVFVHDRKTGETTRVSVDSAGLEGNGTSYVASISSTGRHVAFWSASNNLVAGDGNGADDIFVHDLKTGETERVSVDSSGLEANSMSLSPSISPNGRFVSFISAATNLVPGDTNGAADIFVHDRQTDQTTRVSVDSAGLEADKSSFSNALSSSGRYVTFMSYASNLVPGDANGEADIFVHDRVTGLTSRVSVSSAGLEGNDSSDVPSISSNGRYVAFTSGATNLVPGDTNGKSDVFVHDLKTGQTTRVSVDAAGLQGNDTSSVASITGNGLQVAFRSSATNLVPDDTNAALDGGRDIFVRRLK